MDIVQKRIITTFFVVMVFDLILYQFYFYEGFTGKQAFISGDWAEYAGPLVFVYSLIVAFLLLRDLYLRDAKGKFGWTLSILFFFLLDAPIYYFKYGAKPR